MIEIINISNPLHKQYLQEFIDQSILPTFRYYQKRSIEAVKNHILTLLDIEDNTVRGYAHIDYDDSQQRHFLGICVLPPYQKNKIGSLLLQTVLEHVDKFRIHLYLTVDKENIIARKMYEKYGFTLFEERETFFFFQRPTNEPKLTEVKRLECQT